VKLAYVASSGFVDICKTRNPHRQSPAGAVSQFSEQRAFASGVFRPV